MKNVQRKNLSLSMLRRIPLYYREGWTPEAIAELMGLRIAQVKGILIDAGHLFKPSFHPLFNYHPPEVSDEMTPRRRQEHEESLASAFRLKIEIEMLPAHAKRIFELSEGEIAEALDIDPSQVRVVKEVSRKVGGWAESTAGLS